MKRTAAPDGIALTKKAWAFLESRADELKTPGLQVVPLCEFLRKTEALPPRHDQRETILHQAELLFENLYAHRPFKEKLYPDARPLESLARVREASAQLLELDFHTSVLDIFDRVRDAHTGYGLPAPFSTAVAFLPFQLRRALSKCGHNWYFVTKVMDGSPEGGFGHPAFGTGARIMTWNGIPIGQEILGANEVGGNDNARLTRGLVRATIRPLRQALPPAADEELVTLEYYPDGSGNLETVQLLWGAGLGLDPDTGVPGRAFSLNPAQLAIECTEKRLWYADRMHLEKCVHTALAPVPTDVGTEAPPDFSIVSMMPEVFEFQHSDGTGKGDLTDPAKPEKIFGYVRIRAFDGLTSPLSGGDALLTEFRRILTLLNPVAPDGLIIDIRSNPGGEIASAEHMLQLLAPQPIMPAQFHLPNTSGVRSVLEAFRNTTADLSFAPWLHDNSPPDAPLTGGMPLSETAGSRALGQPYMGPLALVIDGFTYSAADIFAGGFADHGLGTIVGVGDRTGGGGASVLTHEELLGIIPRLPGLEMTALPKGITMSIAALRSSRVGKNEGVAIEDAGVAADVVYEPTFGDVTGNFGGLFRFICSQVLSKQTVYRIEVAGEPAITATGIELTVQTRGLVTLICRVNNVEKTVTATPDVPVLLSIPVDLPKTGEVILLIEGRDLARDRPLAVAGVVVRAAEAAPVERIAASRRLKR